MVIQKIKLKMFKTSVASRRVIGMRVRQSRFTPTKDHHPYILA